MFRLSGRSVLRRPPSSNEIHMHNARVRPGHPARKAPSGEAGGFGGLNAKIGVLNPILDLVLTLDSPKPPAYSLAEPSVHQQVPVRPP